MSAAIETVSATERRIALSVPLAEVSKEVQNRLKRLQRTVRMAGFRPGKVPFQLVARQYGQEVQVEVLNQKVGQAFNDVVNASNLRVAGSPRVEPANDAANQNAAFTATFEVYPEIKFGDFKSATVEKLGTEVGDVEVDKTIEILRKQRVTYVGSGSSAQDGDRVTCDYSGTIDGVPFAGGQAQGFQFELGAKRMLPEFEAAALGMVSGESKSFEINFPADYHGADVAGKTAVFNLSVIAVESPVLPPVDAAFAQTLGIADGNLERMRAEICQNLEREVAARVRNMTKESVMAALLKVTQFDCPKSLIASEAARLAESTREDMRSRGMNVQEMPFPADVFAAQAERRVRLGLVLAELVDLKGLKARPDQLRAKIEDAAQSYENPTEVIKWYFADKSRLADVEAVVLEDNVVEWVLGEATVVEKIVPFDELMAKQS
jgi:trigger factor